MSDASGWGARIGAFVVAGALAALLTGCGGGGGGGGADVSSSGGGATGAPPGGSAPSGTTAITSASISESATTLGNAESLVVTFDGSAEPGSISVTGTLAAEAAGTWSSTVVQNDTYTLAPSSGSWRAGPGRTVSVSAQGAGGGSATVTASYVVNLVFDPSPAAMTVIGQGDFITGTWVSASAHSFNSPTSVAVAPSGRVFVSDSSNNRVLGFRSLPPAPGASADMVLGQADFTSSVSATTRSAYSGPFGISVGGGKMAVVDRAANRVLIYNSIPDDSSALPDVVVGQPGFTSGGTSCAAAGLSSPSSAMLTEDGRLLVADFGNARVLVWNAVPTTNGKAADVVIGQSSFTQCAANDDNQDGAADATPSARTLTSPTGVWSDGRRLAVVDSNNNRVLLWNNLPSSNFAPADVVIGQASFTGSAGNDDDQDGAMDAAPTARTLNRPDGSGGIAVNGDQLAIADAFNNRVLVWNHFPATHFAPADFVLGQADFTTGAFGAVTAQTMTIPFGLTFSQDKLLVVDIGAQRVLGFASK